MRSQQHTFSGQFTHNCWLNSGSRTWEKCLSSILHKYDLLMDIGQHLRVHFDWKKWYIGILWSDGIDESHLSWWNDDEGLWVRKRKKWNFQWKDSCLIFSARRRLNSILGREMNCRLEQNWTKSPNYSSVERMFRIYDTLVTWVGKTAAIDDDFWWRLE